MGPDIAKKEVEYLGGVEFVGRGCEENVVSVIINGFVGHENIAFTRVSAACLGEAHFCDDTVGLTIESNDLGDWIHDGQDHRIDLQP